MDTKKMKEESVLDLLNTVSKEQMKLCTKKASYLVIAIFTSAWGFLFTAKYDLDKFLLSLTILCAILYFFFLIYREYHFACRVRILHEQCLKQKITIEEVNDTYNKLSDWTYKIFRSQLIFLALMVLVMGIYIVRILW